MTESELAAFPLLADLDREAHGAIARALEERQLEAGERVFEEGEPADALLLLARGRVSVSSRRAGLYGTYGAGATLGALSLVAEGSREASAETLSRTRLLVLRREAFERLVERAPRAAVGLLAAILRDNAELVRPLLDRIAAASIDPRPTRD